MDYLLFISSISLFGLSMCFSPGPNNAMAMSIGMERGFRAVVPFCLGCGCCAVLTQFLTGMGLGEAFARFPLLYKALRYAGTLYILWLAWKISGIGLPCVLRKAPPDPEAPNPNVAGATETAKPQRKMGFFQGVLLQLVNVKVWMTNIILISNYVGYGDDALSRLIIVSMFIPTLGTTANFVWAAGGVVMRRFLTSDGMRRANYVFAIFLVLSIVLLYM